MLSGNEKLYDELINRFEKHGTADIQKINAQFKQSCAQLAALSWDQLLECGAAFGTTLVLDAVACHTASYATTQAGRAFVQTVSELLSAPQAQATEHMVEIAGLGKIALDEGPAEALSLFKKTAEAANQSKKFECKFDKLCTNIQIKLKNIHSDLAQEYKKLIVGKGSTGRMHPKNLTEQLAMKEVLSNPLVQSKELKKIQMTDTRWQEMQGWVKMSRNINGVEIHFVYNKNLKIFDDFKFKEF